MQKVNFNEVFKDHINVWQSFKVNGNERILNSLKMKRLGLIIQIDDETYNFKPFIKKLYNDFKDDMLPVYLHWESFEKEQSELISTITEDDYIDSLEKEDNINKNYLASVYLIKSWKCYRENDFINAISFTNKALDMVKDYAEAYYLQGFYKVMQSPERYSKIITTTDSQYNAIDDFHEAMSICNFYSVKATEINFEGIWFHDIIFDKFVYLADFIYDYFIDDEKLLNTLQKHFCPENMKITYDHSVNEFNAIKMIYKKYKDLKEIINYELRPEFDKIHEIIDLFFSNDGYNFSIEYLMKRLEVEFKKLLLSDQIDDIDSAYHYERRKHILNLKSFYFENNILYSKKHIDLLFSFNFSDETYIEGDDFNYLGDNYGDEDTMTSQKVYIKSMYVKKDVISKKDLSEILNCSNETEITWFDAVKYLNMKSMADDLKPCYSVDSDVNPNNWNINDKIDFDANADGYRLPSLIEWAYITKDNDYSIHKYGLKNLDKKQFLWDGLYVSNEEETAEETNAYYFRYVRNISRPELQVMPNWLLKEDFTFNLKKVLKDSLFFTSFNFPADFCDYTYSFIACNTNNSITEIPVEKLFNNQLKDFEIINDVYLNFDDLDIDYWNVKIFNHDIKKEKTRVSQNFVRWIILKKNSKKYSALLINADPLATYQALYLSNNVRPKFLLLDSKDYDNAFYHSIYFKDELTPKYISTGKIANQTDEYILNTMADKHTIKNEIYSTYHDKEGYKGKSYLLREF
ncbi:MAG: hypothetical protein M0Q94_10570 [Candidatus Cloacimonetes bacterium]|nr:hypothetical protein [Candidatus Cloacimonadota bacterium]